MGRRGARFSDILDEKFARRVIFSSGDYSEVLFDEVDQLQ